MAMVNIYIDHKQIYKSYNEVMEFWNIKRSWEFEAFAQY
jgi:hypothetical protein